MPEEAWEKSLTARSTQVVDAYKAAADVARQAVADQVSELDAMRNRATTFLAFVGSATAFLVGTAINGSGGRPHAGFVITGLAGCVALVAGLAVFASVMLGTCRWYWPGRPWLNWDSRLSGKMFADWLHGDLANAAPDTAVTFYRHLANQYELQFLENSRYLDITQKRYLAFMVTGFTNLVLWAVAAWLFGIG